MKQPEWIWGRRTVLEALRAGRVCKVSLAKGLANAAILDEITRACAEGRIRTESVDREQLDRLCRGQRHQGVVACIVPFMPSSLDTVLCGAQAESRPALLLVLDQIQDPRNLGGLLRTAEAAGVHGVILVERRSAPLSDVVARTSAGALYHLLVATVSNLAHVLTRLEREGIWTVGLADEADRTVYQCDLTVPLAMVMGAEGSGLRRLTRERVDMIASIPMQGRVESLNASVAGGIALFEAVRQRRLGDSLDGTVQASVAQLAEQPPCKR